MDYVNEGPYQCGELAAAISQILVKLAGIDLDTKRQFTIEWLVNLNISLSAAARCSYFKMLIPPPPGPHKFD